MESLSFHHRKLPHEIQLPRPQSQLHSDKLDRFLGSMVGLAVGDALGASFEFRPREYFLHRKVEDMEGGGTWGLPAGHWTDDTSMALCLASSLITTNKYDPYDQMVRYKRWYDQGYLSSTGRCFDIGNATKDSLEKFKSNQRQFAYNYGKDLDKLDDLSWKEIKRIGNFEVNCSSEGVAGNGALMRLAPLPLFFSRHPKLAVEYAGCSARLTHGDRKAVDACRYYAALILAAIQGYDKKQLTDDNFHENHRQWFGQDRLHPDIVGIARGSYKRKNGYEGGIRGTGYIVNALEAALWAFHSTNSFEKGALAAVNLGDDTDTTAAIYGQLAGAYYGYNNIPDHWKAKLYARNLIICISEWLLKRANEYNPNEDNQSDNVQSNYSYQQNVQRYSSQPRAYDLDSFNQNRSYNSNNNAIGYTNSNNPALTRVFSDGSSVNNRTISNSYPMNNDLTIVHQHRDAFSNYDDRNSRRRPNVSHDYNRDYPRRSTYTYDYSQYPNYHS